MARKNALVLTMEEIQAGLSEAHSEEEKMNFLMSLTVKQLKDFAKHQDCIGIKSSMKKADIAECIINNIEMDKVLQEIQEQSEIGTKQPELNEISDVQAVDCEAENRTVEKVLALYVPPKQSVKNCHRLSKALIAEQRLEKWKVKHAVFWARGMPDKTKRKFLKRVEEF